MNIPKEELAFLQQEFPLNLENLLNKYKKQVEDLHSGIKSTDYPVFTKKEQFNLHLFDVVEQIFGLNGLLASHRVRPHPQTGDIYIFNKDIQYKAEEILYKAGIEYTNKLPK